MKIVVDGMKPNEVLSYIIDLCIPEANYMSDEAVRDWVKGALEMVAETFPKSTNRMIRGRDKIAKVLEGLSGRQLLMYVFDLYLSGVGMGRLPGFGFAKCENVEGRRKIIRHFMLNPEKNSIYGEEYR